ncbi:MAG: hypothetical protein BWX86_02779 [Verrucomicrobia bacterium ADurb.Bin122]|nr:MAG: hypothetical protein BWX86_02779 [Verrucomicrobia bacterium ADurb.Bin122]
MARLGRTGSGPRTAGHTWLGFYDGHGGGLCTWRRSLSATRVFVAHSRPSNGLHRPRRLGRHDQGAFYRPRFSPRKIGGGLERSLSRVRKLAAPPPRGGAGGPLAPVGHIAHSDVAPARHLAVLFAHFQPRPLDALAGHGSGLVARWSATSGQLTLHRPTHVGHVNQHRRGGAATASGEGPIPTWMDGPGLLLAGRARRGISLAISHHLPPHGANVPHRNRATRNTLPRIHAHRQPHAHRSVHDAGNSLSSPIRPREMDAQSSCAGSVTRTVAPRCRHKSATARWGDARDGMAYDRRTHPVAPRCLVGARAGGCRTRRLVMATRRSDQNVPPKGPSGRRGDGSDRSIRQSAARK